MTETVTLILPPAEAALFVEFQKHHDKVMKLLTARVFDVRDGSVVIHYDHDGNIRTIDRHDHLFSS